MKQIGTSWLRGGVRKFIGKSGKADLPTNGLLLDLAKNNEQLLALRVNELFDGKNLHFADSHAKCIVEQAIEFIKIAQEKVESAEIAKCAAEAELERYRTQVKGEIDIKIREVEKQMKRAALRLSAAEQRATAAEQRADKAETEVRRLGNKLQAMKPRLVRPAA
jgi:outer membrane murein-binding lipoprotein Lpp